MNNDTGGTFAAKLRRKLPRRRYVNVAAFALGVAMALGPRLYADCVNSQLGVGNDAGLPYPYDTCGFYYMAICWVQPCSDYNLQCSQDGALAADGCYFGDPGNRCGCLLG